VVDGSAALSAVRRVWPGGSESHDDTQFEHGIERGARWLSGSALYRWLTAEPEPDVLVIDLRETWTVGPVLKLLDKLISWMLPYWRTSRLSAGVDTVVELTERAAETRYGQAIASVLTPPDPPVDDRGAESKPDENRATHGGNERQTATEDSEESTIDTADTGDEDLHGRQ
jgi:hypothetical protein